MKLPGLRVELLLAILIADDVYTNNGHGLVITSLLDGIHSRESLHHAGSAADLRTTAANISKNIIAAIAASIRKELMADYDVLVERDHIHLEFQPRRPE